MMSNLMRAIVIFCACALLSVTAFAADAVETKEKTADATKKEAASKLSESAKRVKSIREKLAELNANPVGATAEDDEDGEAEADDEVSVYAGNGNIADELTALKAQIEEILGTLEGMNESNMVSAMDLATLKKTKFSGYIQFQWEDTNNYSGDKNKDGFRNRRSRIKLTHQFNDYVLGVIQAEFAGGDNGFGYFTKDAYVEYDIIPPVDTAGLIVRGGLFDVPFSYEKIRSSSERELPERSTMYDTLLKGQRDKGVMVTWGPSENLTLDLGLFTGLTAEDDELKILNAWQLKQKRLAVIGRLVYAPMENIEVGYSGLFGRRPQVVDGSNTYPQADRELHNLEFRWYSIFKKPGDTIRAEYLWGKDRVMKKTARHNVEGWYIQYIRDFGSMWQATLRYDTWDENTDVKNGFVSTVSAGVIYHFNSAMKLVVAFDHPIELGGHDTINNDKWTIRAQYKY